MACLLLLWLMFSIVIVVGGGGVDHCIFLVNGLSNLNAYLVSGGCDGGVGL